VVEITRTPIAKLSPEERRLYDQMRYRKRQSSPETIAEYKRRRKARNGNGPSRNYSKDDGQLPRTALVERWAERQPTPIPPPNVAQSDFIVPLTRDQLRGRR
jgi:hypothetical protein